MKLEAYIIAEEQKVLVVREDEFNDLDQIDANFDPRSDAPISEYDPRLTQEVVEIDPNADAYEPAIMISIY